MIGQSLRYITGQPSDFKKLTVKLKASLDKYCELNDVKM